VTALGDLDQDGIVDMAVGAFVDDDGGTNRGAVWVLFLDAPPAALYFAVDPALLQSGWQVLTETHTVGGAVFDTAEAHVLQNNRSVFLSQTGCASALARLSLGYIEGNLTVEIDYTTTHSGAETEELHFMLVAGSQLIAGIQANFPRSR